jgi:hypothetical protein
VRLSAETRFESEEHGREIEEADDGGQAGARTDAQGTPRAQTAEETGCGRVATGRCGTGFGGRFRGRKRRLRGRRSRRRDLAWSFCLTSGTLHALQRPVRPRPLRSGPPVGTRTARCVGRPAPKSVPATSARSKMPSAPDAALWPGTLSRCCVCGSRSACAWLHGGAMSPRPSSRTSRHCQSSCCGAGAQATGRLHRKICPHTSTQMTEKHREPEPAAPAYYT